MLLMHFPQKCDRELGGPSREGRLRFWPPKQQDFLGDEGRFLAREGQETNPLLLTPYGELISQTTQQTRWATYAPRQPGLVTKWKRAETLTPA